MTLSSAYIELFIRVKGRGGNVRGKCLGGNVRIPPEWMRVWLLVPRIKVMCNIEPVGPILSALQASHTVANSGGAWWLNGKVGAVLAVAGSHPTLAVTSSP